MYVRLGDAPPTYENSSRGPYFYNVVEILYFYFVDFRRLQPLAVFVPAAAPRFETLGHVRSTSGPGSGSGSG